MFLEFMTVAYNEAPYLYQLYKYFNEMKILEWNETNAILYK